MVAHFGHKTCTQWEKCKENRCKVHKLITLISSCGWAGLVKWVLVWTLTFLLKMAVLKYAALHHLPLLILPRAPPKWLSRPHTPTKTSPHLYLTHKSAPKPPRRQQHRWIVHCASKIPGNPHPDKKEFFDPWSILGQITYSKSPSQTPDKNRPVLHADPSWPHTHMERATLSTHHLHYPSVPMTHTHPNPHPNSELVWPLRIPPARPWLTPWAETMATRWE